MLLKKVLSNKKINNIILNIRENSFLTQKCAYLLLRNEFDEKEVKEYTFQDNFPRIILNNGLSLISHENYKVKNYKNINIPESHLSCAVSYILRYKYPHFDPSKTINTKPFPRKLFPALIHRQHLNTFFDLPYAKNKNIITKFKLHKNESVLEAGAFIGMGTLKMSNLIGPKGKLLSIEADNKAYSIMLQNLKNNNIKNTVPLNCAISNKNFKRTNFFKENYQRNSLIKEVINYSNVEVIESKRLDSICSENNLNPTFIILTVNDAEYTILKASQDYLSQKKNLRLIVPGWYSDKDGIIGFKIVKLLKNLGFKIYHTKNFHIFALKE
jgi:FkbM family methyltransferase